MTKLSISESIHKFGGQLQKAFQLCILTVVCVSALNPLFAQSEDFNIFLEPQTNWDVEVIVFIQSQPDEAFRDRIELDDYRDIPALPALLTQAEPTPPFVEKESFFATTTMADAWKRLQGQYQRLAYYRWQQPSGRGGLRRLHDDQAIFDTDNSLSLGPHFQLDGRLRVSTNNIGYTSIQLVHRSPLQLIESTAESVSESLLWRTLKLKQERRIQANRIEYFDSAGLALLILMTPPSTGDDETETTE